MANIHHLIAEDTIGSEILKKAGNLGADRVTAFTLWVVMYATFFLADR